DCPSSQFIRSISPLHETRRPAFLAFHRRQLLAVPARRSNPSEAEPNGRSSETATRKPRPESLLSPNDRAVVKESRSNRDACPSRLLDGTPIQDTPTGDGRVSVLVMDKRGATHYRVPDRREDPESWPWIGLEDEEY